MGSVCAERVSPVAEEGDASVVVRPVAEVVRQGAALLLLLLLPPVSLSFVRLVLPPPVLSE